MNQPALASPWVADYHNGMAEREARYKLGAAQSVTAETFGRPGRRTFRLVAEAGRAQSYIWLEKEQLFQLGLYLQQAVKQLGQDTQSKASAPGERRGPATRWNRTSTRARCSCSMTRTPIALSCTLLKAMRTTRTPERKLRSVSG